MPVRTNDTNVKAILVDHYDTDNSPALTSFIQSAASLVNKVESNDEDDELDDDDLELIERWLAAHFYAHSDQIAQSQGGGGANGTFQGQTGMVLESTQYGQTAMLLDTTGYLAQRSKDAKTGGKSKARVIWLGSTESERRDYQDRQ